MAHCLWLISVGLSPTADGTVIRREIIMSYTSRHHVATGKYRIRVAFTLIELLAVIAIIAILAAILFPVFARARENARRASCQSNLKQLGLGILQYQQDYDEKCPQGPLSLGSNDNAGNGTDGMGWAGQIYPYVKSTQIYTCPSDITSPNQPDSVVSYGYNLVFARANGQGAAGVIAAMTAPVRTVLLFEVAYIPARPANVSDKGAQYGNYSATGEGFGLYCYKGYGSGGAYATGNMGGQTLSGGPTGRHLDGSNFLMGDGHVKWLRGDNVSRGNLATNATDAQNGNQAEGTGYSGAGAHAVTFSTK